jgi:hypothetical protein
VGGVIADVTYSIIKQRIFMSKKYEQKNISTFAFIFSLGQNVTLINTVCSCQGYLNVKHIPMSATCDATLLTGQLFHVQPK